MPRRPRRPLLPSRPMASRVRPPPDGLPSWRAFGLALLHPARPRLAEAIAVATGLPDELVREAVASPTWDWLQHNHQHGLSWTTANAAPQWASSRVRWNPPSLWEALATRGLIPDAWVDHPGRRFHGGGRWPSITEAVLLAADPDGVALAESLARETAERLAPWLHRVPRAVRWRLLDWRFFLSDRWNDAITFGPGGEALGAAMTAATLAGGGRQAYRRPSLTASGTEVANSPNVFRQLVESMGSVVSAAEHWRTASRAAVATASAPHVAFATAPDPFAPLLSLWARGYGLFDTDTHLTLVLPTFDGFGPPTRVGYFIPMSRTRPARRGA